MLVAAWLPSVDYFIFYFRVNNVIILLQAIAGNIMTASPISDLNPLFVAAGCILTVVSKGEYLLCILCKNCRGYIIHTCEDIIDIIHHTYAI